MYRVNHLFYKKKLMYYPILIGVLFTSLLFVSYTYLKKGETLPAPEYSCNSVDWKGIVPGTANRKDVINILGKPDSKGRTDFGDGSFSYYAYQVENGDVANYAQDRIYFRSDGVVGWIEEVVADRNGDFEGLYDEVKILNSKPDVYYRNNNYTPYSGQYDVLGFQDELFIWSGCGVVVDTLPDCSYLFLNTSSFNPEELFKNTTLQFLYPTPYHVNEPEPDLSNIVLMKIIFPPTSYQGFSDYFMYKIRYDLWDSYIRTLKCRSGTIT